MRENALKSVLNLTNERVLGKIVTKCGVRHWNFQCLPQPNMGLIRGLAEGANLLEGEDLQKDSGELRKAASSV